LWTLSMMRKGREQGRMKKRRGVCCFGAKIGWGEKKRGKGGRGTPCLPHREKSKT